MENESQPTAAAAPQVSHLMDEMSEDGTACVYQMQPLHLNNFIISHEDQMRLDSIEEWFSDFTLFEETPTTLAPTTTTTVHSNDVAAVDDDSSSSSRIMHCQVAPSSTMTHHRKTLLRDASVQVTCQHDDSRIIRPTSMVDAAVQVSSLQLNNTPTHSIIQRTDDASQARRALSVHYSSRRLPSILAPSLQDFSFRDGTSWSSGSSLRLSCDEESNNLRPPQHNLEMLVQRLPSSGLSKNKTPEDNSPASAFKTSIPHSSRQSTIVSSPSILKFQRTTETLTNDSVTNNVLHCTDSHRLDTITKDEISLRFNHSTQIDCLQSSQHCLVEPDFPLSPVKHRSEETGCASQLSDTFETVLVGDRMRDDSSRASVYRQTANAGVSVSHDLIPKDVHQQIRASMSDVPNISSATALTSLTLPCADAAAAAADAAVSLSCITKSTTVLMASVRTLLSDNQSQTKSKASHQPNLLVLRTSSEAPHRRRVSGLDSGGTNKNLISKQDLPPPPLHSVCHPVTDSNQKQQLITVSMHKTDNDDDDDVVITSYEKPKSVDSKIEKSSNPAKGSRLLLRQRQDYTVLFAKPNLRKRLKKRRHKLFNIDQKLNHISSDSSETDNDDGGSKTHFRRSRKQQTTFHEKRPYCIPSIGKSMKTKTGENVNRISRVMLEPPATGRRLSGTVNVTDRRPMQKTLLSHEVTKEPDCSGKEPMKKSIVIGATGVRHSTSIGLELDKAVGLKGNSTSVGVELDKVVGLKGKPSDDMPEMEHIINRIADQEDKVKDGGRTTARLNQVQTAPSEFTFHKRQDAVECNQKTGALGSNSQNIRKYLEVRGSNVARDKRNHLGITNTLNSQSTFHGVSRSAGSHDRSCDYGDIVGACIVVDADDMSDDSPAINYRQSEESLLKQTVSKKEVVKEKSKRDSTSHHNKQTDENYRSLVEAIQKSKSVSKLRGASISGDLQNPKMLTLPPPKNLLTSYQPQKQSTSSDLQPQNRSVEASHLPSPVDSRPSSPKLNRDRIQMLLGRDKMTTDEGRALSSSGYSRSLMSWTYNYFRHQPF